MYIRETRVLLRHYLEQGVGKIELAGLFGVSQRTIYYWIKTGQLDRDLDDEAVRSLNDRTPQEFVIEHQQAEFFKRRLPE